MSSLIIGTAGHIDHGKTALIHALNGFNGDTLKEEKERGITINLSFSNLKKDTNNISFIDVPGHENLVKTMISGAFGFDISLLVIAANDGIMPQTKEHILILNLLGVKNIVLAITKCDLVDKNVSKKVLNEAEIYIKNSTNLEILNSFFVSVKEPQSIEQLREYLFTLKPKFRQNDGLFRYYIDRVFSIKGIGSVVTGSVISGSVKAGEKIHNYALDKELGVRCIQTHDNNVLKASHGTRVALNLTGCELSELKKGQLLSKKGFLRGFLEVDAVVFSDSIKHNQNLTFCIGSRQLNAKVVILSSQKQRHFVNFKFNKKIFAVFNEPFILLLNSRVIGGGRVLNPISEPLKKQVKISLLDALDVNNFKKAFEILKASHKNGFGLISSTQRFGLSHEEAVNIAKLLPNSFVDEVALNVYDDEAIFRVKEFIKFIIAKNQFAIFSPLSISLKLGWASEILVKKAIFKLCESGLITKNDGVYIKTGVDMSELKFRLEDKIYEILDISKLAPKAPYNIYDELDIDRSSGDKALKKLTVNGKVVRLAHNLFVTSKHLENAMNLLKEIIKKDGFVNIQNAKSSLNLSRKYIIAYLEKLDFEPKIAKNGQDRILKV